MKIISIDPGYDRVGLAVIEKNQKGKEVLVHSECISTSSKQPLYERILSVGQAVEQAIRKWKPGGMAIEELYFAGNQKTAMAVSEARGAIIYEASKAGLKIFEYTPIEIKVAVTGYGRATKEDVHTMVKRLISLPEKKRIDDEVDAIAVGLCCFARERFTEKLK